MGKMPEAQNFLIPPRRKLENVMISAKFHKCDIKSITKDILLVNSSLNSNWLEYLIFHVH